MELGEDRIGNPLLGDKTGVEGPGQTKKAMPKIDMAFRSSSRQNLFLDNEKSRAAFRPHQHQHAIVQVGVVGGSPEISG